MSPESRADYPLAGATVSAGFPSPADDYMEAGIDLNRELIRNPGSTFFGRVKGTSMKDSGIHDGDVLIIDKSVEPYNGAIAVCFLDGEFTVKRIRIEKSTLYLVPENREFKPIAVTDRNDFMVWGVVTYVIKKI
jgi:DNA polymerase V